MDMEKVFSNLSDQLAGAIQKSDEAKVDAADKKDDKADEPNLVDEVRKSVDDLSEQVKVIAKALAPGREAKDDDEGEEPGSIVKAIKDLSNDHEKTREALEKALERIEALEKGTVVRKSAAGTDEGGDDGPKSGGDSKGDDGDMQKGKGDKNLQEIGRAMKYIATHPGEAATLV